MIAAGGIMDGRASRPRCVLGASAAQLGTAFIGCQESDADAGYRQALASDAAFHTVMTRAVSGRTARCLSNGFTALGAKLAARQVPSYPIAYDAGKALNAAAKAVGDSRLWRAVGRTGGAAGQDGAHGGGTDPPPGYGIARGGLTQRKFAASSMLPWPL